MTDLSLFATEVPGEASNVEADDTDIRAGIYARTSSPTQKFGHSITEQIRRCRNRCELRGWTVVYIFQDEAESGEDTDRPMFKEMMQKVEQNVLDVVIVWKLDRLSRSLMHAVQLEERLRGHDVALHSVTEQVDTTNPAGRFNFRNIANAAEFERELIQQRTQMGMEGLALDRKWPNDHPPLGYIKKDDDRLEIDEEEASLVNEIFERYIRQQSMPKVADALNGQGISTKKGNEWTPRAIRDVLRNELYIGKYEVAGVSKQVDDYQIVDPERFEKVQEIRYRFRTDQCERGTMDEEKKAQLVDGMIEDYRSYLFEEDTGP